MTEDINNSNDFFSGEVKIFTPPHALKEKAGEGGIPASLIERAQDFIKNNDIDFSPFAAEHIKVIEKTLKSLKKATQEKKKEQLLDRIIENIMHIKSHGSMFNYQIMTELSDVALTFLEATDIINEDLYEIIEAHNQSIQLIINHSLKGNTGPEGNDLIEEFKQATVRFQKKYDV